MSKEWAHDAARKEVPTVNNLGGYAVATDTRAYLAVAGACPRGGQLAQLVQDTAVSSATKDYRFANDPVTREEVDELTIDISVLSPMHRIEDPMKEVVLGKHGIYIKRGHSSGTFLPQVATEHNMTKEEFLSSCCSHKAGLAPDAWQDADTEVYVYSAQVFADEGE